MILHIRLLDETHGAPVVRLFAWKTLVWSEARNAEGEKENDDCLPQAYALPSSRAEAWFAGHGGQT